MAKITDDMNEIQRLRNTVDNLTRESERLKTRVKEQTVLIRTMLYEVDRLQNENGNCSHCDEYSPPLWRDELINVVANGKCRDCHNPIYEDIDGEYTCRVCREIIINNSEK